MFYFKKCETISCLLIHFDVFLYRALQEAQDIFGVDFDMSEFDQYGEEYDEEDEADLEASSKMSL